MSHEACLLSNRRSWRASRNKGKTVVEINAQASALKIFKMYYPVENIQWRRNSEQCNYQQVLNCAAVDRQSYGLVMYRLSQHIPYIHGDNLHLQVIRLIRRKEKTKLQKSYTKIPVRYFKIVILKWYFWKCSYQTVLFLV